MPAFASGHNTQPKTLAVTPAWRKMELPCLHPMKWWTSNMAMAWPTTTHHVTAGAGVRDQRANGCPWSCPCQLSVAPTVDADLCTSYLSRNSPFPALRSWPVTAELASAAFLSNPDFSSNSCPGLVWFIIVIKALPGHSSLRKWLKRHCFFCNLPCYSMPLTSVRG